jgi:ABC-type polysaccharide/polyol phosphate export permease
MPPIIKEFAFFNPMSYIVDAVRSLIISGNLTSLPIDLAAITIFNAAAFTIASINIKKIVE